jgi:hypothetical protein
MSKIDRVEDCAMTTTNSKLVLAVGLAAATLVVFLTVTISGGALRAGLAPWPGIGAIVLATSAFNTGFFAVIVFPGPILGVIIGLGILGLGVAKGVRTARTAVATPR